ncbi:MAG: N-acetyltransferase [Alphaproteobacteria bacterium]|nr:N-acetyltransferase [Alphaproteobacteria bacterium]
MAVIRREASSDTAVADAIVAAAFGPGRFAKSAYRLREGVGCVAELSFVAEEGARIVGTVRYWPVLIGGKAALMLGPIAIVADRQGQGIALALMQTTLAEAKKIGHRAVILVGDEPYYGRAGFARIQPVGRITMPGPVDYARLLGLSLVDGALEAMAGEVRKARITATVAAAGCALG